jgi:beta-glucosidase
MALLGLTLALPARGAGASALEQRVEKLLAQMTLEEKLGQMTLLTSDWDRTGPSINPNYQEGIRKGTVGAVFNAYTAAYTRKLQTLAVEQSRLHLPLLFGYDVIHGHRTIFPIPLGEAASFDLAAIERSARIAATEAAAEGLHWTFAPMVDLARDARWGRIAEGAGEEVYLGCEIARARIRGFQGTDLSRPDTILACAKHYAAYGAAQAGRDYHTVDLSPLALHEVYLPPFKAAADAGVATFMTAFNELNGIPCTGNRYLLTDLLRRQWGFAGFTVTDYTSINEMVAHGYAEDLRDAGRLALLAGADMDMQGSVFANHGRSLVRSGDVPMAAIDESVRRILTLKGRLGLFDDPYRYCDPAREKAVVMSPAHLAAARETAAKSLVLLRNERRVLPLADSGSTIAVVGPLAHAREQMLGSWSGAGDSAKCRTVLESIRDRVASRARVLHSTGCAIDDTNRSGFGGALAAAAEANVIVAVMGEAAGMSGEAASRADLGLPGMQQKLLERLCATGKPVVLVLMSGRPLAIPWAAAHVPAILEAWFPGTMGGPAIADVLFGDVNPSGKLPVTFPRSVGQVPIFLAVKNTGRPLNPEKPGEKYVSRYLDVSNEPLYPFGHGLSYTSFGYSAPRLSSERLGPGESLRVEFDVTNTGSRPGDEVAQLYLRDLVGSVTRPLLELKRFERFHLAPGQRRTVRFTLGPDDLAFVHPDLTRRPEPGEFRVLVGPSSGQLRGATFRLTGARAGK